MTDNVTITPGSGAVVAADEVTDATLGTVKVQYVKLMDGTLDGTSKATVGSSGLKVDGSGITQPISVASLPLPAGAATAALQSAAQGAFGSVTAIRSVIYDANGVAVDYNTSSAVTQSGTWTVGLSGGATVAIAAGTAIIGKVGIDSGSNLVSASQSGTWSVSQSGTWNLGVTGGGTASGTTLTANPVTTGGLAKTALPTAVTDGQVVNRLQDKYGRQIVRGTLRELMASQTTTITSSTTETTIVTADAANKLDLFRLVISNSSATDCNVTIKDGTGGTTRWVFGVKAGTSTGFAGPADAATPQASINANWTATCSASVASIVITADYVKAGA